MEALDTIRKEDIHLVIMDIMMPNLNGTRATMEIRKEKEIPIIMLSAKSEDSDIILGLNLGADDYLTKPFNPLELIARVNSQIRRYTRFSSLNSLNNNDNRITVGALELDKESKSVTVDNKEVKLTPLEFKILSLLMNNLGRVFSIEEIYERVWNEAPYNVDTVTVHIRRIREKIEVDPRNPQYLKVVWGIGYKLTKNKIIKDLGIIALVTLVICFAISLKNTLTEYSRLERDFSNNYLNDSYLIKDIQYADVYFTEYADNYKDIDGNIKEDVYNKQVEEYKKNQEENIKEAEKSIRERGKEENLSEEEINKQVEEAKKNNIK